MLDVENIFIELVSGLDSARLHRRYLASAEGTKQLEHAARVFVVATGKCAQASVEGCFAQLGERITAGVVVDDSRRSDDLPDVFAHYRGDHPYAYARSAHAADRLTAHVADWRLTEDDLVIVSVSGGTSSLIASPVQPLTIEQLALVHECLLTSGLTVTAMNGLRRKLSRLHDGGLLHELSPARVLTLLQADNAQGSNLSVGSGPTMQHPSCDASATLEHLRPDLRAGVAAALRSVAPARIAAGRDHPVVVLSDVPALARTCADLMEHAGLDTVIVDSQCGESWSTVVDRLVETAEARRGGEPTALIVCGEATVAVPEDTDGLGGRCQQVALGLSEYVATRPGTLAITMASDGRDRIEGVRGAVVDHATACAMVAGMSVPGVLEAARAHRALAAHGALLRGDRTRVNLCDAYMLLVDLSAGTSGAEFA